jgi:hypothetical protein
MQRIRSNSGDANAQLRRSGADASPNGNTATTRPRSRRAREATGSTLAAILGVWVLVYGCKKEDDVEYPQTPPRHYASGSGAPTTSSSATPTTPPAAGTDAGTPPPVGDAGTAATADGGAQPLNPLSQQLLEQRIKDLTKKHAAGMKPAADVTGGVVAEGGQVEIPFMIESQRCYGVIAVGGTGVTEVDIQIVAKPGAVALPGPLLAQDTMQGTDAAIAPCWKNPFPLAIPATAILKATRGGGELAGRVFSK